jgi:hypothetical protein
MQNALHMVIRNSRHVHHNKMIQVLTDKPYMDNDNYF